MNEHNDDANIVHEPETSMNRSDVHLDPFVDIVPAPAGTIHDTPMESALVADSLRRDKRIEPEVVVDTANGSLVPLLNHEDSEHLRTRWQEIQGWFVDDPRAAVQQADTLVSNVIDKIIEMFANEHSLLEGQWKQGNDVSTEDLRQALQHYRSFFNRLVV